MFITDNTDLITNFLSARDAYELSDPGSDEENRARTTMEDLGQQLAYVEHHARITKLAEDRHHVSIAAQQPYLDKINERTRRHKEKLANAATQAGRDLEHKHYAATMKKLHAQKARAAATALHRFDRLISN